MILKDFLSLGAIIGVARACRFSLPYVPVLVFPEDLGGAQSLEIYLPLYGNSTDCFYPSRAEPIPPGESLKKDTRKEVNKDQEVISRNRL